jgi:hypothetical protein
VPGQLLGNANIGWIRGVWREDGVVRKVLVPGKPGAPAHWAGSEDPAAWNYWRREELVYTSGLPAGLGLDAPALLGVERHGEEVHLLLEDVHGRTGAALTLDDLTRAARLVGHLASWPIGQAPDWLSRGFLRDYPVTRPVDWSLLDDETAWANPLVREHVAPVVRREALLLRGRRGALEALQARLPAVFCHLDVWPHNLIARPDGHIAFLDWSFCGHGRIGEDVGNLVPDSVFDRLLPSERLDELDAAAGEAYLEGLRDGGFAGDPRAVRLGVCLGGVLKYDWLVPHTLHAAASAGFRDYGSGSGVEAEAFMAARGAGLGLVARWAAEARGLAEALGLSRS